MRTSRRIEDRRSKTGRNRESQGMRDRENIKWKKSEGSYEVFGMLKKVYSRV